MTYEGLERVRGNIHKIFYQLQPKTKALVQKLERILIKIL